MLSDDNSNIHYLFSLLPTQACWKAIAGDWDGDGLDSIGLYKDGTWILSSNSLNPTVYAQISYGPMNNVTWKPVVGDWNADNITTVKLSWGAVT